MSPEAAHGPLRAFCVRLSISGITTFLAKDRTGSAILSTTIRRDAEGRYCLNDCHRASGGKAAKGPSEWRKNAQTHSLVSVLWASGISPTPLVVVNDGINNGTYVVRELVYAYAMWISPTFYLEVIRTFDDLVSGRVPVLPVAPAPTAEPSTPLQVVLRQLADSLDENEKQQAWMW